MSINLGDLVIYAPEPDLYGIGVITDTQGPGWYTVRFDDGSTDLFLLEELEPAPLPTLMEIE